MSDTRRVAVLGVAQTPFGNHPDRTLAELFTEPLQDAAAYATIEPDEIDAYHVGNHVGGRQYEGTDGRDDMPGRTNIAAEIADDIGAGRGDITRYEAACASSAVALRHGYDDIAYGKNDIVAAGGMEILQSVDLGDATAALGTATAADVPSPEFPGVFAAITEDYAAEYDKELDDLLEDMAHIGVKNREYGAKNPNARFYDVDVKSVDEALETPVIADPLTLYDCCANADGGSVVLIGTDEVADEAGIDDPVYIAGIAQKSGGTYAEHGAQVVEPDFRTSRKEAADEAYGAAGVEPVDIDVAEVHDCFTIDEIKAIEDLGFFAPGEGDTAARNGNTRLGGEIPVNVSGGLIANGHPVGATGTRQITSLVNMLRAHDDYDYLDGELADAEYALADTMGGDLGTSVVTVLQRA